MVKKLPKPYFTVVFVSQLNEDASDYSMVAKRMMELVTEQPDFLGVDSTRNESGFGITVSYWKSLEDIKRWKNQKEHANVLKMQRLGMRSMSLILVE